MSRVRTIAINAADHLVAKNRLEAAASILEKYLSTHRDCPEVLRRLGRIRLAMQQPDDAAALFERSLAAHRAEGSAEDTGEFQAMSPLD
ncbi:MAG: tetratricopeptide repeat protein [Pseudomonadota bacterium]